MRRTLLSLLLPLLLLLGQQGAVVHELSHLRDDAPARHGVAGDAPCALCLAFAGIAGGAVESTQPAPLPAFGAVLVPTALPSGTTAESPAPRSRGPPSHL